MLFQVSSPTTNVKRLTPGSPCSFHSLSIMNDCHYEGGSKSRPDCGNLYSLVIQSPGSPHSLRLFAMTFMLILFSFLRLIV